MQNSMYRLAFSIEVSTLDAEFLDAASYASFEKMAALRSFYSARGNEYAFCFIRKRHRM